MDFAFDSMRNFVEKVLGGRDKDYGHDDNSSKKLSIVREYVDRWRRCQRKPMSGVERKKMKMMKVVEDIMIKPFKKLENMNYTKNIFLI